MAWLERQGPGTCLVVDDNSFDRCMLRRCLGRDRPDLELFEVDCLAGARAFLTRRAPDMILLDHRLPDGQGASFARELKKDERLSNTLLCVVTNADPRLLDPDVLAMSKDDLTPQALWTLIDGFLAEGKAADREHPPTWVAEVNAAAQENLAGAVSRMLRTLRRARSTSRRSIPSAAMSDLDSLEEMLLAFSEVVERRT
ncbi:response regulator [Sagittula marina]|nr:response regulator [Sagittula marina]